MSPSLMLAILVMGVTVFASSVRDYQLTGTKGLKAKELNSLAHDIPYFYNQLKECDEDSQDDFSSAHTINRLQYSDDRGGVRTFTVEASGHRPAPSFRPFSVSLTIKQKRVKESEPVASDKPSKWDTDCSSEVKSANK